jgi:membrane protease YdiL (CAAX protease family)
MVTTAKTVYRRSFRGIGQVTRTHVTSGTVAKRWFILAVPPLLIASMYGAFRYFTARFGSPTGYLVGFGCYWVGWCVLIPTGILGTRGVLDLFSRSRAPFATLGATTHVLLWSPLVFPLTFSFLPRVGSTSFVILVASVVLGIVTGVTEELLWRGVFITAFPNQLSLNTIYPSIAFGLWHLCPLSAVRCRAVTRVPRCRLRRTPSRSGCHTPTTRDGRVRSNGAPPLTASTMRLGWEHLHTRVG